MSIQLPKFTYIGSTSVDNRADGQIFKVNIKEGKQSIVSPAVNASGSTLGRNVAGQDIEMVNVKLGIPKPIKNEQKAYNDVTLAPASGMTIQGVLTYGSGKITNTTVWGTDQDLVNKGDFVIFRPIKPTVYNYNSLAT